MKPLYLLGAALVAGAAFVGWRAATTPASPDLPATVRIPAGPYVYRAAGEFRVQGKSVDPPLERRMADAPLIIMKYPVGLAEYAACVAGGACLPTVADGTQNLPQTQVSWHDATAYARWFSRQTGMRWRLPTDAEWQRAAAERFVDDAVGMGASVDPAARWLAEYRRSVATRGQPDLGLRERGSFGENSYGVADMSGNVWEWTDGCVTNAKLDADGAVLEASHFCGARIAEGRHRAVVIDFVRDARSGGCAAGLPPDHLGFRLVRDR
ncbi:MAG: sulfatase activating formylglycine-generating enzyme [Paracoccaceae bacterium]|jgi:formylglycine-generating enzyme required for sulfatase activity